MKFKNLKLGGKLTIGFGFFILFLLVASITEFVSLKGNEKKNRTAIKSYDLAVLSWNLKIKPFRICRS